jgi:cytidine deaminase
MTSRAQPKRSAALAPALRRKLIAAAKAVRLRAYAPYSNYLVGSAILAERDGIYCGCNVENVSYGGTICAERGAVMQMIAAGRKTPKVCVIVTGGPVPAPPCGLCRQVLAEFAPNLQLVLVGVQAGRPDVVQEVSLSSLFPGIFTLEHLQAGRTRVCP